MQVIEPSWEIWDRKINTDIYRKIEDVARICYKSETNSNNASLGKLTAKLVKSGHEAMLEHDSMSAKFICDRAISHQLVRHRLCSFAQESQRYCNYALDRFDQGVVFVRPYKFKLNTWQYDRWYEAMSYAEKAYMDLLSSGETPEWARSVLPNSTKTELLITANWREWRHIFRLRAAANAHPQMVQLMAQLLKYLKQMIPPLFDDISSVPWDYSTFGLTN